MCQANNNDTQMIDAIINCFLFIKTFLRNYKIDFPRGYLVLDIFSKLKKIFSFNRVMIIYGYILSAFQCTTKELRFSVFYFY